MQQPLTILIGEDDAAVAQVLQRALQGKGHTVLHARDGRAVVEAVRDAKPAIVLLDVQMPLLQGVEAVRAVRRHDAGVPIMMMTGANEGDFDLAACCAAGARGALIKPFRVQVLLQVVEALAAGEALPASDRVLVKD